MNKRKRPLKTLVLALVIVFICGGILLAAVQTAFAWYVTMLHAMKPFKIGTDSQQFLKKIRVAEPPMEVIKTVTCKLYASDSPSSPKKEVKSGTILNRFYTLTVEITLKEGEIFHNPENVEFIMEPFKHISTQSNHAGHVKYKFTADLTKYRIVRFDANGGTPKTQMKTVKVNGTIKPPTDPKRTSYKFDGWWTSATGGKRFNFSQPILKDIKLFAHWVSTKPTTTTTKPTTTTTSTTTTTTTATTTTATTTEEITTVGETAVPTTVEETTTEPSELIETSIPDTTPSVTTAPIDSGTDAGTKFPWLLIIIIVVVSSFIGGLAGYLMSRRRDKKR